MAWLQSNRRANCFCAEAIATRHALQARLSRVFAGLLDFVFTWRDSSDAASQCRAMVSLIKSAHVAQRIAGREARGFQYSTTNYRGKTPHVVSYSSELNQTHSFFGLFFRFVLHNLAAFAYGPKPVQHAVPLRARVRSLGTRWPQCVHVLLRANGLRLRTYR